MAQTRKKNKIDYDLHDPQGHVTGQAQLDLSPDMPGIADEAFFRTLEQQLREYNDKHAVYLMALNQKFNFQADIAFEHLEDFLFPNMHSSAKQAHEQEQQLKLLFNLLTQLAFQAIKARSGGFLGIGANDAAYQRAKTWLQQVASYAESKIVETPWYVPVPKEAYLLTALSDSPEAFIQAQADMQVEQYVTELNDAKKNFPKEQLKQDGSNFSKQVTDYIGQIDQVHVKFSNIGSSTVAEIQRIEHARQKRGAFINFFRDWFSSEKQELEALKNRQKVAQALQDSYTRLASGVEWVKFRNVMKALGDKLLQTPASLSSAEVDELRNAVGSLLNHRSYEAEAKSFVARLQSKIVAQIGALAKSADPSLLTNQFAFLAENKIVGAAALNEARVAVINAIKQQAVAFEDPQTALRFIENLKTAKYECLDASGGLSRYLDEITKDYQAWKALQENGPALLAGALDAHAVKKMRDHAIRAFKSALPRVKEAAKVFDESLRKVVIENVTNLQVADELKTGTLISILEKHLQFYTLDERYAEEPCFNASKAAIREHVNKTLEEYTDASEAQAYIGKWDKLNQEILKAFDIALYQDIQNKRNQYKSLDLIQKGWVKLLDDTAASQMTTLDVEHFIAAVLWLDKPNTELSNPLIELLKQLSGVQQKFLQVTAREKLAELKESLLVDLAGLAQASPSKEKREALKHRLKFITQANAMYTDALGAARKAVISALKSEIAKEKSIKETKRYLDDLESVLPDGVKDDAELRKAIYDAKRKLVYDHFEDDYKKILKKYETQMEFLRTGELSLWEKIEATFTGEDPRALTEENLDKWRSKFLHELTSTLTVHAQIAVDMAGYGQNPTDREEAEAVHYFLKERIRDDYKELSRKAKQDLIGLTDLRGQRARERLDRIFGLKPSQPVDKKAFLRCYLAVASYQTYYRNDAVLVDAGRDFIREFHEIAQHEGGFVTQIVAKMSKDELDALFLTWDDDPTVKVKKKSQGKSTALESDIVGVVDASRDSHVQVPRYLLLNMVLELIAADFDALLRGEKVDIRLLNDRIEFAIPKLQRQVKDEMELNGNRELRGDLAVMIQGMNPTTTRDSYLRLVANQLPQGTAQFDTYGVMRNLKDCESKLLDQIRFALRDQLDILDGITPEHLDYRSDEESIKILEQQILLLRDELERVQRDGQMEEGTRAEKTVVIARSIASLEAQKMEYANNIAVKKAQTKWVRDYQEYLVEAQSLLKNDGLSLREFIAQMKPCLFELLDPQLAGFCRAVRENVEFAKLLGDEEFTRQLHQLGRDLQGNTRETLDIVRDIPENITRQLPSETADMIRQLQYRFADRFKHLMVKMLDKNNLSKIHASDEASAMSVATVPVQDKTTPFWGSLFTGSTKPVTVPNVTASKPSMPTVHERLKTVLKRVESRVLKQMLAQLAETADANSMNIDDLYGLTGEIKPSKPIAIAARSSDSSQDPSQEGQRQGMHVGNPFARNYYF